MLMIKLREYQARILDGDCPGVVVLHWARQIGKSYALAAWAVDRLFSRQNKGRLVTVLSNSRENGAEFLRKCVEVCGEMNMKCGMRSAKCGTGGNECGVRNAEFGMEEAEKSASSPRRLHQIDNFKMEMRITRAGMTGRIKVLAANPRTARGFSGDLILDEFAFHEDSAAIWEAAEPILASNPDFRCRIASTGNGKHNMFYRMVYGMGSSECGVRNDERENPPPYVGGYEKDRGEFYTSASGFVVSRVTRTAAHAMGVKIYDLKNQREEITPEAARAQALDKRAYDQNYECAFADENMTLLTYGLISSAQSDAVRVDAQEWSGESLRRMQLANGSLEVGNDIGRNRDVSVVTVIEREGQLRRVVGMLKLENMRLPEQQRQIELVCRMPRFRAYCGDMTGLGLGLVEYLQERFGVYRIRGVNFSATEPVSERIKLEGRAQETARVTEIMAVNLLACFEEGSIKDLPDDEWLVEDLRKPEKITSPGGRVSIAATRNEAGHADGFWSLALAVRAGEKGGEPAVLEVLRVRNGSFGRGKGLML
jgi:phage FluMu gp28-like protein